MSRVLDTLRETALLNDRVAQLSQALAKLDTEQSNLRDRVTRIEALIEFTRAARLPRDHRD